jgi:hypothetical protein
VAYMLILEALEGFEGPLNTVRYADLPIDDSFAEEYFAEHLDRELTGDSL